MKKRGGPAREMLVRLLGDDWETWEMGAAPRRAEKTESENVMLAVPARLVICSPIWIDGTDPAIVREAAKLEMDVRGLTPRSAVDSVMLRLESIEERTLVVASVFSPELPEGSPAARRFEASPLLLPLAADSLTLWREGGDLVAAVTRGRQVVYWETCDRTADAAELKVWLGLILMRLRSEGTIAGEVKCECMVDGLAADRVAPPGCPAANSEAPPPSVEFARWEWRPETVVLLERRSAQREKLKRYLVAAAAAYAAIAICIGAYFGFLKIRAGMLASEARQLQAEVDSFQPVANDWTNGIGRTANPESYPLEILSEVVSKMPKEGVQLTTFKIDDEEVTVVGEADSTLVANDFSNAVADGDSAVQWTRQTPVPMSDNRASFTIVGNIPAQ